MAPPEMSNGFYPTVPSPLLAHHDCAVGYDVDPATLDAALAFVDEYELSDVDDAPGAVSRGIDNDASPRNGSPVREKSAIVSGRTSSPPSAASSARMRQRDELVYLRGVVDELEDQLSTLKKRGDEGTQASNPEDEDEPLSFVWERLAERQYKQRQRAEVENVKLRSMLEEQIRVAKNLERLLKKRTTADLLMPSSVKRIRKSTALDDRAVFDDLLAMITDMYPQVDEIFADERFACKEPAVQDQQARNDSDHGPVVEVFDSQITPFDMHSVADALWHHMSMQSFDRKAVDYQLVEISDEVFKLEYRSSLDLPRLKGSFHGKVVGRKFVEDDRILLLWAALVDPDKVAGTSMDGVYMRQKGWTMVRRPPSSYERPGRPATASQMYHIIIPEFNDQENEDEQRRKVGTLTNFVLSTVDFHLEVGRTTIENLLLDDGWKTSSPTSSPETSTTLTVAHDVW